MDLKALVSELQDIRDSSSRLEKEEILEAILDSDNAEVFKTLCAFLYNDFRKLNVTVTNAMIEEAEDVDNLDIEYTDEKLWTDFLYLLELLEARKITGNAAKEYVVSYLSKHDDEVRGWFAMFFNKNWKIGVGRPTIEKFLGKDFAPKFEVQLCEKWQDFKKRHPAKLPSLYMAQRKIDGVRAVCGMFNVDREALSRTGQSYYNWQVLLPALQAIDALLGEPHVVDGEFYYKDFKTTMEIVRRSKSSHPDQDKLQFHAFDIIPMREWNARTCNDKLRARDKILKTAIEKINHPSLLHVGHNFVADYAEVDLVLGSNVEAGWEGIILKDPESLYSYDRNHDWIKLKLVKEVDATIVGYSIGIHDPNTNEIVVDGSARASSINGNPVLRTITVDPGNGIHTDVGSGFSILDRYEFFAAGEAGKLIGRNAEIHYQEYTPDGKLRFPIFKHID